MLTGENFIGMQHEIEYHIQLHPSRTRQQYFDAICQILGRDKVRAVHDALQELIDVMDPEADTGKRTFGKV